MRISIFGGGIFGITTFLILRKKGLDCYLYEKEKELLSGATTKNLNRVHLGYHYPRDKETVFQSQKGFYSFTKLYSHSIIKKFDNHYAIAESSKVKSEKYEKFSQLFSTHNQTFFSGHITIQIIFVFREMSHINLFFWLEHFCVSEFAENWCASSFLPYPVYL